MLSLKERAYIHGVIQALLSKGLISREYLAKGEDFVLGDDELVNAYILNSREVKQAYEEGYRQGYKIVEGRF